MATSSSSSSIPDPEPDRDQDWFSIGASWLNTAKQKTVETYELVKKDLSEFTDAVHTEASALANATASTVKQQAANIGTLVGNAQGEEEGEREKNTEQEKKQEAGRELEENKEDAAGRFGMQGWMKSFVDTVKNLAQEDTTLGERELEIPVTADLHAFDNAASKRLYLIQTDPGTYSREPEGASELFDDWMEHFSMDQRKHDISQLLASNPAVRALYSQLVPSELTNALFWQRYFYKVHQFQLDEARRRALLNRSSDLTVKTSWGDSDGDAESGPDSPLPVVISEPQSRSEEDEAAVKSSPETQRPSPGSLMSPDRRSSTSGPVDETWSVCSNHEMEIREIPDDESAAAVVAQGPLTPRAEAQDDDVIESPKKKNNGAEKKGDDWVEWDDE